MCTDERDKLILVFYVDVRDAADVPERLNDVSSSMYNSFGEGVISVYIPHYGDSRLECINPVLLSENEYEDVRKRIEVINEEYEKLVGKEKI